MSITGVAVRSFPLRRQIAPAAPGCGVPPPRDRQEEGGLTLLLHHQQAPTIVNLAADLVFCRFPGSPSRRLNAFTRLAVGLLA